MSSTTNAPPNAARIESLLQPFVAAAPGPFDVPADLYSQLEAYLVLLLRWNVRTNLTAIRDPETIVVRHFGESLFAGLHLAGRLSPGATLLDVGSGAGFPGLPIQLLRPDLRVTLAESQGKKVSFLREAVRTLGLGTEVFGARVESMAPARHFDAVTLRAVDNMPLAISLAAGRLSEGGWLAALCSSAVAVAFEETHPVPGRSDSLLGMLRSRGDVPRGTAAHR